jgi:hypothetical protein
MNPYAIIPAVLKAWHFIKDPGVIASAWSGFWAAVTPSLIVTLVLGLPSAIYVCLKIYREFIKPQVHPELDAKLKEKARKAALKTQNGKIFKDYSDSKLEDENY